MAAKESGANHPHTQSLATEYKSALADLRRHAPEAVVATSAAATATACAEDDPSWHLPGCQKISASALSSASGEFLLGEGELLAHPRYRRPAHALSKISGARNLNRRRIACSPRTVGLLSPDEFEKMHGLRQISLSQASTPEMATTATVQAMTGTAQKMLGLGASLGFAHGECRGRPPMAMTTMRKHKDESSAGRRRWRCPCRSRRNSRA